MVLTVPGMRAEQRAKLHVLRAAFYSASMACAMSRRASGP